MHTTQSKSFRRHSFHNSTISHCLRCCNTHQTQTAILHHIYIYTYMYIHWNNTKTKPTCTSQQTQKHKTTMIKKQQNQNEVTKHMQSIWYGMKVLGFNRKTLKFKKTRLFANKYFLLSAWSICHQKIVSPLKATLQQ